MLRSLYFCLFIFYVSVSFVLGQSPTDSLWRVLAQKNMQDTSKVLVLSALSHEYRRIKPDTSLLLAQEAAQIAYKINFIKGIGKAENMIGRCYLAKSDYNKALEHLQTALNFSVKVKDELNIALIYGNMGAANRGLGKYDEATDLYFQSLTVAQTINYQQGIAGAYSAIGIIYKQQGNYEKALDAYFNALKIREQLKDKQGIADSYNNLGYIYMEQENYDKALLFFHTAFQIRVELGDKQGIGDYYGSVGLIQQKQKNYDKALEAFFNSIKIREEIGDKKATIFMYSNVGLTYLLQNRPEKTLTYLEKGLQIAKELDIKVSIAVMNIALAKYYNTIQEPKKAYQYATDALTFVTQTGNIELIRDAAEQNSIASAALKMYPEAYQSMKIFKQMADSIQNTINKKQALVKDFQYKEDKNKIEQEKKELAHKAILQQQRWIIYIAIVAFFVLLVIALVVFRNNLQRKKTNQLLKQQKNAIEINNKNTNNSIAYAKRIQTAILPSTVELEQILGRENFFILYKPRNVVSGDFYWFADKGESKIFAVADCTGHGVPGAFMSMIGNALLNYIIHDKEIHLPHLILRYMNEGLEKAFHQNTEEGVNDTIEIALITVQEKKNLLFYAGAMSSMYMIQNNNLEIWKGDKFSLGDRNTTKEKVFTQITIPILPQNTQIYLFSDGYQDQFGGYHHKKFMSKQFRELLFDNHKKTMSEQQQILDAAINQWISMGNETQTDDITVMGVRL